MTGPIDALAQRTEWTALEVLLRYLKAEGAEVVFGIPGGLLHPFFAAVDADPELRLVIARHEEGAAFMADGYARVSRRLAVCAATGGPGATNLVTGVACAFADGVPLLVITGQVATPDHGRGALQETGREGIDIVEMFRPITKYTAMVTSAASLARHLRRALRLALTGRQGPVHLNVPLDLWREPVREGWFEPDTYRPRTTAFDRAAVQQAAEALLDARYPALLAGSGVYSGSAEGQLMALAELLPARVATSPRGKGSFPEDHPLSLGVLGFAGHAQARETMLGDTVDVLLTAGSSLNETTTYHWSPSLRAGKLLLQIDIDPDRVGRNYPVDIPLVGDVQTILTELLYHLHRAIRSGRTPSSRWGTEPALVRGHERFRSPALRVSDAVPITPQRWRHELEEVLPPGAVIVSDTGGHTLFNLHDLCLRKGQSFVLNLGFASMGHGVCAPIGAALAEPSRPVIAIVGDACFTMNGMELVTAVEYGIPVIWIVENNYMHGITFHGSKLLTPERPLECVRARRQLDIAGIARAMGLAVWVVDRPGQLGDAVCEAIRAQGPALIDVRVDPGVPPPLEDRALSIAGQHGSPRE
ncbi:MAG: thiamine pyrophosphate-binding protein [Polyangiaceae bacterium]|nr:thiamine pyrophosphate-binding protein [Polyangiaceae bacterium]